ncbi:MAG TPA: diguanylate cyclase [Anaerolineales bacterium]|nr:diguanylate cyclase [Anaerolineales bacterium]
MTITEPTPHNGQSSQANSILMRWVSELEQRSREATVLLELNEFLEAASSRLEAIDIVAAALERLFPGWSGMIGSVGDDHEAIRVQACWGGQRTEDLRFDLASCRALKTESDPPASSAATETTCDHFSDSSRASQQLCIPVSIQEKPVGLISLRLLAPKPGEPFLTSPAMTESRKNLLRIIADQLGLAIRDINARQTLGTLQGSRQLASFNNHLYLEEMLERELQSSRSARKPMSLVYFSLDMGDEKDVFALDTQSAKVLKKVGVILASSIRKDDSAAVAGSNLFVVVLKNTNEDQAMGVARRIRGLVGSLTDDGGEYRFAVPAIGLAVFPPDGSEPINPLAEAKRAFQAAQAEGSGMIHLLVC